MTWSTRKTTLDPGIVSLVLRGQALNGSGWRMIVYRRARRAVRVGRLILEGLTWLALVLAAIAILAAIAGVPWPAWTVTPPVGP